MKISKMRWDDHVRAYLISLSNGITIQVSIYRDLDTLKYGPPEINCSATGSLKTAAASRYVFALRKALFLADKLRQAYQGR